LRARLSRFTTLQSRDREGATITTGWYAFTEQGVAMLSSVLKSKRAIEINIGIMRTFVHIRQLLSTNEELARTVAKHDRQIAVLFENVQKMLAPVPLKKKPIGFVQPKD
jgi:hypothetical protein